MSRRKEYSFQEPQPGAPIFWRSLQDKISPENEQARAKAEFDFNLADVQVMRDAGETRDAGVSRRGFMLFAGSSATLFACARRPVEKILPYAKQPEHLVPGISSYYATSHSFRGDVVGFLVESHEGRPTKIEGNPDHPGSLGATSGFAQAAIWDLYDPDRSREPALKGHVAPKHEGHDAAKILEAEHAHASEMLQKFDDALSEVIEKAKADGGAKLRILLEPNVSPSVRRLRAAIEKRLPQAKIYTHSAVSDAPSAEGAKLAFDQAVGVQYEFDKAKVIVSVDSDFLGTEGGSVRAARGFANGRKLRSPADSMNRLYVVEPSVTVTGLAADHRLRLPAVDAERYLVALSNELRTKHGMDLPTIAGNNAGIPDKWIAAVAKDLVASKGKSIVKVGARQPARVHALGHAINWALGNVGTAIRLFPANNPSEKNADPGKDLKELASEMASGKVDALVMLGGNPVYDAPGDVKFAEALAKVKTSIHLSSHRDETSRECTWHVPRAHFLECWGDHQAVQGQVSIQQPLIAPLHASRDDLFVLAKLANEPSTKSMDVVRATFRAHVDANTKPAPIGLAGIAAHTSEPTAAHAVDHVQGSLDLAASDRAWTAALKKGVAADVATAFGGLSTKNAAIATAFASGAKSTGLEVTFAPCPKLFDGRHANNPWMLELPDPVTKLSWDNAACVSPVTAKQLSVETGDIVRLSREGAAPVVVGIFVLPGQADNSVALTLGWGRQDVGRYGSKKGFNIMGLRTSDSLGFASGVKVEKLARGQFDESQYADLGKASEPTPLAGRAQPVGPFDVETGRYRFVQTQEHGTMEGRPIAIDATLAEYKSNPKFPLYPGKSPQPGEPNKTRSGSPDPKVLPLWKKVDYSRGSKENPTGYKWGMVLDLNACTGCNACVLACQSENNVPAVGKDQIARGREMSWLRIDRYFVGADENEPQFAMQPVACVQCEDAPCENVCPVNATEHSPEGLNDMAYNRCIGTRYCANNCPYKVRRFNFLNYHGENGDLPDTEKMHMNPNVTIRMRGVMEKCNYCVQRIQEGKIASKRDSRTLKDGDIQSACQQACPSEAIVFGDLNDPSSRVAKLRDLDRSYRLLAEIGTSPRTTYLGKIRNLNPELAS